jgi:hypothetical protein
VLLASRRGSVRGGRVLLEERGRARVNAGTGARKGAGTRKWALEEWEHLWLGRVERTALLLQGLVKLP